MDTLLSLQNIKKIYKGKTALDGIDIQIKSKEIVCIIGGSGCGKSTLLKIISNVEKPSDGRMVFDKAERKSKLAVQRRIGIVFQQDCLMEWRTLYKNVKFPLEVFGLRDNGETDNVLKLVGLYDFKTFYPYELSGGMRKRAAIARALVHNPDLVLLDQPFDAIDAITREILAKELLRICHRLEKTVVIVTNSVDEAILLGKRVIVLSDAPATVLKEVKIDIPYEHRVDGSYSDTEHSEYRLLLTSLLKGYNGVTKLCG